MGRAILAQIQLARCCQLFRIACSACSSSGHAPFEFPTAWQAEGQEIALLGVLRPPVELDDRESDRAPGPGMGLLIPRSACSALVAGARDRIPADPLPSGRIPLPELCFDWAHAAAPHGFEP